MGCDDMMLLGKGRPYFLEFLRNLTPQILLMAFSLTLWAKLDFHHVQLSNWRDTLIFYACAMTFLLATFANTMQFIDNYAPVAFESLDGRMAKARRRIPKTSHRLAFLFRTSKRKKWSILFNIGLTIVIVEAGFVAAGWIATRQAIQLLKIG